MIQRIQSIWLLLASITILLLLVIPIATSIEGSKEFWIQGTGLFQQEKAITTKVEAFRPLAVSIVAVTVMCIAVIFSFKKRSLQKKLCYFTIAMIVSLSFWVFTYMQKLPGGLNNVTWNAGIALPVLAIVFCVLAIRGITKDEQLLRSADRLR